MSSAPLSLLTWLTLLIWEFLWKPTCALLTLLTLLALLAVDKRLVKNCKWERTERTERTDKRVDAAPPLRKLHLGWLSLSSSSSGGALCSSTTLFSDLTNAAA